MFVMLILDVVNILFNLLKVVVGDNLIVGFIMFGVVKLVNILILIVMVWWIVNMIVLIVVDVV